MPKLILLGDSGVGKSSLIKSLVYYENESSIMKMRPTIGVQFITTMIQNQIVEVCDIDGHGSFSTINLSHFNEANGIIVVFDVNVRSSFENALSLILEIKKTSTINHNIQGPKIPLILVGTKIDLASIAQQRFPNKRFLTSIHVQNELQFVSEEEQKMRGGRLNVILNARTSAKSSLGVTSMFLSALQAVNEISAQSSHSINLKYKKEISSPFFCLNECSSDESNLGTVESTPSAPSFDSVISMHRMSTHNSFGSNWEPDTSELSSLVSSNKDSGNKALCLYIRSKTWCLN